VRFGLRQFHNAVIEHGSYLLPYSIRCSRPWIDAQRSGSAWLRLKVSLLLWLGFMPNSRSCFLVAIRLN